MTLTQFNLIIYSMNDIYKIKYFQKEESRNPGSYQEHIQQYKDSLEKRLSQVGI